MSKDKEVKEIEVAEIKQVYTTHEVVKIEFEGVEQEVSGDIANILLHTKKAKVVK